MVIKRKVSTETILQALAARPRLTAAELVEVLGIGQSTAAKHLATDHAALDDPVGPNGSPMVSWAPSCRTTWPSDPVRPSGQYRQGSRQVPGRGVQLARHHGRPRRGRRGREQVPSLPDRRLAQARPGSSQLPAPGTPRGTDYSTSGVVASGAEPAPVARARREISFGGVVGSPSGVPHLPRSTTPRR